MTELETAKIKRTCYNSNVYEPSDDTFLLVDALQAAAESWRTRPPRLVLEIGCGSGFAVCSVALMLQQLGIRAQLCAIDHSTHALEATTTTLRNHDVAGVELIQTDLLAGLHNNLFGQIDLLVFNPPYVPTPDEEVDLKGIESAWAGGDRGRRVIDRVLAQLPEVLAPGGELFMVTVTENDPKGIIQEMKAHGFSGSVVLSRQADEETLSILRLCKLPDANPV